MNGNDDIEELTKIQIIAFTSNNKELKPNDVFANFLKMFNTEVLKQTDKRLSFLVDIHKERIKIMIYTITELNREYNGINDVACYFVFINSTETEIENINDILTYMSNNCEQSRTIFFILVKQKTNTINEKTLKDIITPYNLNYKIKTLSFSEGKANADFIMETFTHCIKQINIDKKQSDYYKDDGQSKSCVLI